jgi:hypothetical protein
MHVCVCGFVGEGKSIFTASIDIYFFYDYDFLTHEKFKIWIKFSTAPKTQPYFYFNGLVSQNLWIFHFNIFIADCSEFVRLKNWDNKAHWKNHSLFPFMPSRFILLLCSKFTYFFAIVCVQCFEIIIPFEILARVDTLNLLYVSQNLSFMIAITFYHYMCASPSLSLFLYHSLTHSALFLAFMAHTIHCRYT